MAMSFDTYRGIIIARDGVFNPQDYTQNNSYANYEWHLGTLMNSVLCLYFPPDNWTVTPEQIQDENNKRPDFVVEKIIPRNATGGNHVLFPHIFVEIKKDTDARFIDAMDQVVDAIKQTVEQWIIKSSFVIVGRGRHIAFFYYFYDSLYLDQNLNNYRGLIPLYLYQTQKKNHTVIIITLRYLDRV
jgi:hypothetical protein